jgi:hypothetical protein
MTSKTFHAEYKGSFLQEDSWEGRVQSSYSKVMNLLHPSGNLISIVDSIDNMTDYGLTVSKFSSLLSRVSIGNQFLWEGDRIIFPDMIVDISGASVWSGTLFKTFSELSIDIIPIKSAFIEFTAEEGLSSLITNKAGNLYSNAADKIIKKAVQTANIPGGLLIDLNLLVGMGIGFTPSGDDFLTGVMLYETISGINLVNRESIRNKLSGTTEGGRTLLILALSNSFPYYLKQFAESVCTKNIYPGEAVKRAIMHGSTSGSDSLTGFIWASEKIKKID